MSVEGETAADAPQADHRFAKWHSTIAIVWLIGFLAFFYCQTPPNNPTYRRFEFWPQVPFRLLDLVDPPADAAAPPSGWSFFPQRLDLMMTAAIILAGAWGIGHLCLRLLRIPFQSRCAERTVFAFALGLATLSLLTLCCGLAGRLSAEFFATFILAAVAVESWLRLQTWRRTQPAGIENGPPSAISKPLVGRMVTLGLSIIPIAPFLLAMLLGAMLPSSDFDVREYHLQGPKEYYQAGQITFLPHNVYTSFPFFTEMLSLLSMTLRGDWFRGALVGKTVLMCFGPLTGLAVYAAGRRWFSPKAGWLAALVYLTMPWTFRISTIAYAEGGLTFFLFVSLLAFAIAVEKLRDEPSLASRQFFLCGLLSGCAMACKYTGVVSVVVPLFAATYAVPFALQLPAEKRRRIAVRITALFLLGTTVTIGPWLVKNLVETRNPVYPLMYTLFGGHDWDETLNTKWRAGHSPSNYTDLPQSMLEVTAGNDWLTPLLFGLAPLSLLLFRRRQMDRYLWLYLLWLFATWWVLTHRIDRFWVPMTPVIAVLAGMGAASIRGKSWRIVSGCGIAAAVLFNLAFIISGAAGNNAFLADIKHAQQPPPGIAFLNNELPTNSRVLMVGEAQVFDAEFLLVYNTVFDHSIFELWSASDIRQRFRDGNITHLFVNWQEIHRYRTTYGYTKFVTPERFSALVDRGILNPPTTLAVELSMTDTPQQQRFQPRQIALPSGEQLMIYNVRPDFSEKERRELAEWGAKLLPEVNGRRLFIVGQVYEVEQ
ncbi:MAG: phospholipid carrier-dependent glycosyltransferase [Planctomycetaceae bacterium]|nr:phospholipid carrier-dependent glycosyltransferase [Planctomycetaceae bacterium]MBT6486399.1 phospholipid carrier-dependent glycosyltransferase [Planctomycetaceae bacterium]MBT6496222.1 phospholipid carrier-dependent glycosyltransferase [Planctomycetaceae bacterium]